jgi:hypothetical protein
MVKKYLSVLLIALQLLAPIKALAVVSEADKAALGVYKNYSINGGAEYNKAGWLVSGTSSALSNLVVDTTNKVEGNAGFTWTPANADNYLSNTSITIVADQGLSGKNCTAVVQTKTSVSTHKLELYDGSNVISSADIPISTGFTPVATTPVACGASGTLTARFNAGGTTALSYDNFRTGDAFGINLFSALSIKPTSVQRLTSGSGTYTLPTGIAYIRVRMVGGGGGGEGSSTNGTMPAAGTGGTTTFGTSLLTAPGSAYTGGAAPTVNSPAVSVVALAGGVGQAKGLYFNNTVNNQSNMPGGAGASSPFGGAGAGQGPSAGGSAVANTGSGGAGGGNGLPGTGAMYMGQGGGSGAYLEAVILAPSATYAYAVGAAGTAGVAGTGGLAGGTGGSGYIEVTEFSYVSEGTAVVPNQQTLPTVQKFTTGSGTYTRPAGVSYIRVRMVGGGGGGGGSGSAGAGTATAGGNTTFGSSLLTANGGTGGTRGGAGTGGAYTLNSPAIGSGWDGAGGGEPPTQEATSTARPPSGGGGASVFGGAGQPTGWGTNGYAAKTNTGSGGAGGGLPGGTAPSTTGGGGGAGAYIDAVINSPSATYAYAVGAAGTLGAAGTNGFNGGNGALGYIEVTEYYGAFNAPVIVNSVTSNSTGAERIERLYVAPSCASTPCTIATQSGTWASSVTRGGTGSYTINFAASIFSAAPTCTAMGNNNSDLVITYAPVTTSSTFVFSFLNASAVAKDVGFHVICMGPR